MLLKKKLKEVAAKDRERFLLQKYRELKLVYQIDRLTDRHSDLAKLLQNSMRTLRATFRCEVAGFLLVRGAGHAEERLFLDVGAAGGGNQEIRQRAQDILSAFLADPLSPGIVNDVTDTSGNPIKGGIRNHMIFPMVITSRLEGAFLLANREKPFTTQDRYFLEVVSSQLDNGVVHGRVMTEHRQARRALKQRRRELETLYEMSLSLGLAMDFETLAGKVLESSMSLGNMDRASVMIYDDKLDELKTIAVIGEEQKIRLVKLGMGKGLAGLALLSRKPIASRLGSQDERFVPFEFPGIKPRRIYALVCIPIMAGEKPLGVVNFAMLNRKKTFRNQDMETLQVAGNLISLILQRQQFYQMSIKDELTDLFTFRYFRDRLQEEVNRAGRYRMHFSLVIFDLDHFKDVNDTYGHPFGNVVLKGVAAILQASIRAGVDMPARFGGEELALILPHTPEQGAFILSERIRAKVEALLPEFEGTKVRVTISGGLACFPAHGDTLETLLQAADNALYRAKKEGRNQIAVAAVR